MKQDEHVLFLVLLTRTTSWLELSLETAIIAFMRFSDLKKLFFIVNFTALDLIQCSFDKLTESFIRDL